MTVWQREEQSRWWTGGWGGTLKCKTGPSISAVGSVSDCGNSVDL